MDSVEYNLHNAISPYNQYCDGYGNNGSSGNSYILGVTMGVGIAKSTFSHPGSGVLDEINAFDKAETNGAYIGQLNMSLVSSFCGPQGLVWGYDIAKNYGIATNKDFPINNTLTYKSKKIHVYDINLLADATKALFGTVDKKRFPLRPGAHVPFAGKFRFSKTPGTIYAALALGIPTDRQNNACLLMEDVGVLKDTSFETEEAEILEHLAKSIIEIGTNQRVEYSQCFVGLKKCEINTNQVGCTLVAAPYFTLAQDALVKNTVGSYDLVKMSEITLKQWEKEVVHARVF